MSERLLRIKSVEAVIGMKKSWVYLSVKAGRFPAPVKLGARAVAWRESEVLRWVASREEVRAA